MGIDIAAVMDTLRLMAVKEGVVIGKPNSIDFHAEVLRSLENTAGPTSWASCWVINGRTGAG